MIRLGVLSDLHIDTRRHLMMPVLDGHPVVLSELRLPAPGELDVDALVLAGDIHASNGMRSALRRLLAKHYPGIPVIMPNGNHDHYGSAFPEPAPCEVIEIKGTRIASATLWTHLTPMEGMMARRFSDFVHIQGATPEKWNAAFAASLDSLAQADADVIVTHHAPSYRSVTEEFRGEIFNGFFVSEIDFESFPTAKLWIHGHVHSNHDYMVERDGIEPIRVFCNPLGYPFEKHRAGVKMEVVEI